ncbi:DNA recombination protein RmuC [Alicyclobacillus cellulosilyticus]|uniref:DNA recombination protein RmuC n=1 Tax=Alicyclobacillus cellulosilyticus TaxID=1003997 RepID=A0A917KDK4_9BACL|nr:DNA recombination protein RmuC [Alicyclobacillus cellulosilyticus]GGJ09453.1 DNA recombination protein RmuC [Alicyclobacillus cellulosilyticus]
MTNHWTEALLAALLVAQGVTWVLLAAVWLRTSRREADAQHRWQAMERALERMEASVRSEIATGRRESQEAERLSREELANTLLRVQRQLTDVLEQMAKRNMDLLAQASAQVGELTRLNEQKLEGVRAAVEQRLAALQEENRQKLEHIRATVDEKLHATLEQRLGESFKLVSERLEQVHRGLGEMQTLAAGVGDLKRVLTNVKVRGVLGEVQLGSLLEQMLAPDQYATNVAVRPGSGERVEFAIRLPARDGDAGFIWLPLDAKFPLEDYQRLLEAQETGDALLFQEASKHLEARIKASAKEIHDKYIHPPATTDFALLFLPVEGLFAEVLRRSGLMETIYREYRVILTGPTTLAALLNTLQMGFRTLAIERRASEVWQLLGAVKAEFNKFGGILEKTQRKLQEASHTIEEATRKTRTIERKLRHVEALPSAEARRVLPDIAWEAEEDMAAGGLDSGVTG